MANEGNYIQFIAIQFSPDGDIDEDIEMLSTEIEIANIRPNRSLRKPRKSILDDIKEFYDEATRRKLTRGIMIIGSVFIVLSGILLIVSLSMSKDIDEVVRNSNELLRDKGEPMATHRPTHLETFKPRPVHIETLTPSLEIVNMTHTLE